MDAWVQPEVRAALFPQRMRMAESPAQEQCRGTLFPALSYKRQLYKSLMLDCTNALALLRSVLSTETGIDLGAVDHPLSSPRAPRCQSGPRR